MNIDEVLLKKVAANARLSLTDAEVTEFLPQLQEVFALFSALDEVDVTGVGLTLQPVPLSDILGDDVPEDSLSQEEALSNSPHRQGEFFVGPKTL